MYLDSFKLGPVSDGALVCENSLRSHSQPTRGGQAGSAHKGQVVAKRPQAGRLQRRGGDVTVRASRRARLAAATRASTLGLAGRARGSARGALAQQRHGGLDALRVVPVGLRGGERAQQLRTERARAGLPCAQQRLYLRGVSGLRGPSSKPQSLNPAPGAKPTGRQLCRQADYLTAERSDAKPEAVIGARQHGGGPECAAHPGITDSVRHV